MNNVEYFNKNKYCIVENAIDPSVASLITLYTLFDEHNDFNPDNIQVMESHAKYADPLMESLLLHMQETMEKNTGLSLYPTYSYYRVYRNGQELKPHTDRNSCEISATLCLGYNYDDSKTQWPIFINDQGFTMQPTDMIIYRGIELNHYREKFIADEDVFHVQCFLHYVDKNGPYKEYKFDKREKIGIKDK